MSDLKDAPRKQRFHDRRPPEVPHHPRVLAFAAIIAGIALLAMTAWFWSVMTAKGFILTGEQANQAKVAAQQQADDNQAADEYKSPEDLAREAQSAAGGTSGSGGKGAPPPAPDGNSTTTNQWELTDWSILSTEGILNVAGKLKNISNVPLTGRVLVYVYIDGVPIATAKTDVVKFEPGTTKSVNLVSDSDYKPGQKIVLLSFAPAKGK